VSDDIIIIVAQEEEHVNGQKILKHKISHWNA